uniref:BardetBiedl syndrome 2 protein putative n=1 Tax=Albugo laibachii Nc14 TaxID=890382 RepID=F0WG89_9STRA|nr:bardetBiedl syndrome 2 protein putative [Albugo laibachii Nc14]|eukprot:CCA20224.1 bardetBiedl syndrome 2 protein putative [Albugo laibachii Nc14]
MLPAFHFHFHQPISHRIVQIAKFDGIHPSLVCGTVAGKVLIHSPHHSVNNEPIQFLNVNRNVTALAAGKFRDSDIGDTLIIGTESSVLAYNVERNADLFYKDLPDGVNALIFAQISMLRSNLDAENMIVVGGNCSIQGYNYLGNETLWTVTSDNVGALALCDISGQGQLELVVGTDDFEISAYQNDQIVHECTETSRIVALTSIEHHLFGYALQNGTVGVYRGKNRAWRVKSNKVPTSLHSFDVNGDGEPELIIGWGNGKIEARKVANGELVHKYSLSASIAGIVSGDYQMDGTKQLICFVSDGGVHGYVAGEIPVSSSQDQARLTENEISKLLQQKVKLQAELRALEGSASKFESRGSTLCIPASTQIRIENITKSDSPNLELSFTTGNEVVIKMIILYEYDAGVFDGESLVVRPPIPSTTVVISLNYTKLAAVKFDIRVLVGARASNAMSHVFQCSYQLPKFAMFLYLTSKPNVESTGCVRFRTPQRVQQMLSWMQTSFILSNMGSSISAQQCTVHFRSLNDETKLAVEIIDTETAIYTNNINLAAEMIQDMCIFTKCRELESVADFPQKMQEFCCLLEQVDELNTIRLKLTGEMADESISVKNLILKAEDARILNEM